MLLKSVLGNLEFLYLFKFNIQCIYDIHIQKLSMLKYLLIKRITIIDRDQGIQLISGIPLSKPIFLARTNKKSDNLFR